jgi:hypothetical protein
MDLVHLVLDNLLGPSPTHVALARSCFFARIHNPYLPYRKPLTDDSMQAPHWIIAMGCTPYTPWQEGGPLPDQSILALPLSSSDPPWIIGLPKEGEYPIARCEAEEWESLLYARTQLLQRCSHRATYIKDYEPGRDWPLYKSLCFGWNLVPWTLDPMPAPCTVPSTALVPVVKQECPDSPRYQPTSPMYQPMSPECGSISPMYEPKSPIYQPMSPVYQAPRPTSP